MLSKIIKDHPILVGAYAQWLVSNSVSKEVLGAKTLAVKLKDRVDELSATSYSTTKSIIKFKTTVAVAKKAAYQAASKFTALKK